MRDTKRLRKMKEASAAKSDSAMGRGGDLFEEEFRRAKKLPRSDRLFEDSWSQLLGEPKSSQGAFYESGSWNLADANDSSVETREEKIWDCIPNPRANSVSDDNLPGIKRVDSGLFKKGK